MSFIAFGGGSGQHSLRPTTPEVLKVVSEQVEESHGLLSDQQSADFK